MCPKRFRSTRCINGSRSFLRNVLVDSVYICAASCLVVVSLRYAKAADLLGKARQRTVSTAQDASEKVGHALTAFR